MEMATTETKKKRQFLPPFHTRRADAVTENKLFRGAKVFGSWDAAAAGPAWKKSQKLSFFRYTSAVQQTLQFLNSLCITRATPESKHAGRREPAPPSRRRGEKLLETSSFPLCVFVHHTRNPEALVTR
jgi:hypothetical protein